RTFRQTEAAGVVAVAGGSSATHNCEVADLLGDAALVVEIGGGGEPPIGPVQGALGGELNGSRGRRDPTGQHAAANYSGDHQGDIGGMGQGATGAGHDERIRA